MPMEVVDVVIVGGGPAGSAAAIELARAGREVSIVDRATFPRDKCCGDGLTTGALRQLDDLGLEPSAVASWQPVSGCQVRSPSGRTVRFDFPTGGLYGAVARRNDLDLALVELAAAAGAKVHDGHALRTVAWSDDGVTVTADGLEPIAARYLVAADGVWSPVRKALGLAEPGYLGEWHAFRQYIRAPGDGARELWVWFEPGLLPGYAWSFPLPGQVANVGFGIRRRPGQPTRSMAELWRQLLDVPHIAEVLGPGAEPESPHRAWPIPTRLPASSCSAAGGRVLFAGDAIRAGDPMTGEGIGQALETGSRAAAAIDAAGPRHPGDAAASYRRALRRGIAVDHRFAAVLSRALESEAGARGAVRIAGASPWTRRNFARWLFEDYPRALTLTPRRWHRGAMHGPGAYGGDRPGVGGGDRPGVGGGDRPGVGGGDRPGVGGGDRPVGLGR
jgi:geranylgeranyl reductase family protein